MSSIGLSINLGLSINRRASAIFAACLASANLACNTTMSAADILTEGSTLLVRKYGPELLTVADSPSEIADGEGTGLLRCILAKLVAEFFVDRNPLRLWTKQTRGEFELSH